MVLREPWNMGKAMKMCMLYCWVQWYSTVIDVGCEVVEG